MSFSITNLLYIWVKYWIYQSHFLKLSSFFYSWRFLVISGLFLFQMALSCRIMLHCNCVRSFISDALSCVICRSDTAVTELVCRWIFLRVCPCGVWAVSALLTVLVLKQQGSYCTKRLPDWWLIEWLIGGSAIPFLNIDFCFFSQTFMNSCCVDHLKCFKSVKINAYFRKCVSKGHTLYQLD